MRQLVELVLGTVCAGCSVAGVRWCPSCAGALGEELHRTLPLPAGGAVEVRAGGRYDGPVQLAVNAWKDRDRWDLDRPFAQALAPLVRRADPTGHAALVPVP